MERKEFDICKDLEDSDGTFAAEDETHGDVDQANVVAARFGKFGLKITFDGNGLGLSVADNDGTDRSEWYLRVNYYIDPNIGGLDADTAYLMGVIYDTSTTHAVVIYILTDGAGDPFAWYLADTGGLVAFDSGGFTVATWEYLQIHWKTAVGGVLEGKIVETAFDTQGAGDNSGMAATGEVFYLGSVDQGQTNYPANADFLYFDDFVIDDATGWIGEYAIPWDRRRRGY